MSILTRVISLDLDDTLWPVAPLIEGAEKTLFAWLEARYPQAVHGHSIDTMRALRARIAVQFPERRHDLTFLRRRALAAQFGAAGLGAGSVVAAGPDAPSDLEALVDEAFEVFLAERNRVEFYADVRPSLTRLRARYRLFAVSNGNADLERCGIGDLFDGHVTAIGAGAAKPDARIFAQLERAAGVSAAEVLHIGDDPLADVVGATRAGMQAVWLNRDARPWPVQFPPPARTISTLAQIH
jgi:FMN hydrolase / 5-amino-6-(5-phospho-D-ribitylamino)uracil phosphatase